MHVIDIRVLGLLRAIRVLISRSLPLGHRSCRPRSVRRHTLRTPRPRFHIRDGIDHSSSSATQRGPRQQWLRRQPSTLVGHSRAALARANAWDLAAFSHAQLLPSLRVKPDPAVSMSPSNTPSTSSHLKIVIYMVWYMVPMIPSIEIRWPPVLLWFYDLPNGQLPISGSLQVDEGTRECLKTVRCRCQQYHCSDCKGRQHAIVND